jgi:hypothetical protein
VTAKVRVVDLEPGTPRGTSLADGTAHRLVVAAPGGSADRYRQAGGSQVGVTRGCGVLFPPLSLNPRFVDARSCESPITPGDSRRMVQSPFRCGPGRAESLPCQRLRAESSWTFRGLRLRGGKQRLQALTGGVRRFPAPAAIDPLSLLRRHLPLRGRKRTSHACALSAHLLGATHRNPPGFFLMT